MSASSHHNGSVSRAYYTWVISSVSISIARSSSELSSNVGRCRWRSCNTESSFTVQTHRQTSSQLFVAAKFIHTCMMFTYWHQTVRMTHAASLPPFNSSSVDQKKTCQWNNCFEFLPVLWHCWLGDRKGKEVKFLLHLFSEAWPNMEKLQKKVGWTKMQVCILM